MFSRMEGKHWMMLIIAGFVLYFAWPTIRPMLAGAGLPPQIAQLLPRGGGGGGGGADCYQGFGAGYDDGWPYGPPPRGRR